MSCYDGLHGPIIVKWKGHNEMDEIYAGDKKLGKGGKKVWRANKKCRRSWRGSILSPEGRGGGHFASFPFSPLVTDGLWLLS